MNAVYFNELDSFAADWLGALWPEATVDRRDVRNVQPADVADFRRCHFFGGIGGWQVALDLAGWPAERPVWTASCPCQPLSCAGKRGGEKDERHLWPELYRLISECRPSVIFGEQVDSADGLEWLDGISLDLEELDYAVGACDLPAASLGAPQRRQRFFWVGVASGHELGRFGRGAFGTEANCQRERELNGHGRVVPGSASDADYGMGDASVLRQPRSHGSDERIQGSGPRRALGGLGESDRERRDGLDALLLAGQSRQASLEASGHGSHGGLELADGNGQRGERLADGRAAEAPWASEVVYCRDDKYRRVAIERSSFPLAHGIPRDLGRRLPELRGLAKRARANRVGRLKGYGNSIVPQVAAKFIRAFMEVQV